jgi:hypothetical protein
MKFTLLRMIIFVFVVNMLIKSYQILSIPPLLTYDELFYATQAQGYKIDGIDLSGKHSFWNLTPSHPMYSEMTGALLIPGFIFFADTPMLAIKIAPILLGSLLPILLGLIVFKITRNKWSFLMTMLIATFNPWVFQFSRMSFDSIYSVFFLNLAIVIMLYFRGRAVLYAAAPLFISFFQYQGHKPLLFPLVLLTGVASFYINRARPKTKKTRKNGTAPLVVITLFSIALTVSYVFFLPNLSSAVRQSEYSLLEDESIVEEVNRNRRLAISNPSRKFLIINTLLH